MKLAFCLFNYFPYGGLQRDFLRIARLCQERGHEVHVYTFAWEGERDANLQLHILKKKGFQNHTRAHAFVKALQKELTLTHYDLVVGFNKMPLLDWYYAADVCYQARILRSRPFWYRLLGRYRAWVNLEKAVFAPHQKTKIMLLSKPEEKIYQAYYQTEATRFYPLPPGIAKQEITPIEAASIRGTLRDTYHIPEDHYLLLMVGSGFQTKGLERSLRGLAALSEAMRVCTHLFVIGEGDQKPYKKLMHHLKIEDRVLFLGGRSDVPYFLHAADLLLHPSYHENTGAVLLEALSSGLPVLTTAVCGYAHYIDEAEGGIVLPLPFHQSAWDEALKKMLLSSELRMRYHHQGFAFAKTADFHGLHERAVQLIEGVGY